jgi:hypothetical protein
MEPLEELQQALEEKLERTRKMIDEFDEGMDYATHCTLQGFAEGLAFTIEELKERLGRMRAEAPCGSAAGGGAEPQ